ncbi:MAG: hypothetical protein QOH06_1837 [Acidobacteriota bacterium]|jgi:hypothetical protein|nr:hypothetical protein [Acidobacteriota bacterium]
MDPNEERQRRQRKRPGNRDPRAALAKPLPRLAPKLALVAPNKKNVLQLSFWVEAKIIVKRNDDKGKPVEIPIQDERCLLFLPGGNILEQKTNKQGIVTFRAPWNLDPATPIEDILRPGLVLPDILEEWVTPEDSPEQFKDKGDPPGDFGKNRGARDDHRKGDGVVHFVPIEIHEYEIEIKNLTEEQKLQHFRFAYEKHGAKWTSAGTISYSKERRYELRKGAVCNQHVNFFLSYWYNFNEKFENAVTQKAVTTLTTFDSTGGSIGTKDCHCFSELLVLVKAPLLGTSVSFKDPKMEFKSDANNHYLHEAQYIRISAAYLRRSDNHGAYTYSASEALPPAPAAAAAKPALAWSALVNDLGNFNVYSLSDIDPDDEHRTNNAAQAIKDWAHKHPKNKHIKPDKADALASATAKVASTKDGYDTATKKYEDAKKAAKEAQTAETEAKTEATNANTPAATAAAEAAAKKATEAAAEEKKASDEWVKSGVELQRSRPAVKKDDISRILWDLDEANDDDKQLVSALRDKDGTVNWDHHGGILLKRGPGGSDPTGVEASKLELWYFPADGRENNPRPIIMKSMLDPNEPAKHRLTINDWFVHLAIWKLRPLRDGGFAPQSFLGNPGGLSIDEPPRFVHWAG